MNREELLKRLEKLKEEEPLDKDRELLAETISHIKDRHSVADTAAIIGDLNYLWGFVVGLIAESKSKSVHKQKKHIVNIFDSIEDYLLCDIGPEALGAKECTATLTAFEDKSSEMNFKPISMRIENASAVSDALKKVFGQAEDEDQDDEPS